jgi:hypothetical protein
MIHALLFRLGRTAGFAHKGPYPRGATMNASKSPARTHFDASPVASVPPPRVPGHENLVIEHLSEFTASSVTSMCISISDSLSSARH